ncbi:MAG: type IV pilus twitching motility protein PilT [Planctomycetota bacterium]|nr:type IV pilus twitching motility protein PilT [Planctomycetota bacterium]MDG2142656.1 type IV pilus twitching motility protein PilT [Planctomycetota bacterium]
MQNIQELMKAALTQGASDLHLAVGAPPAIRTDGGLTHLNDCDVIDAASAEQLCRDLCSDIQWKEVQEGGSSDFGMAHDSGNRFRVSILRQKGFYGAVLRVIPQKLYDVHELGLPEASLDLLTKPRGLVLVTGPTGSGKTTSLAAMLDWININRDRHIITIEDPIEYYHTHKKSIVTQREVGVDVPNFAEALRRALRQDPDVILVGEMRDLETISAAITAAETGHLVFGTLHTTGSARTMDRIIDAFPANQQPQIRAQLSTSIEAVISQVLLPRADGNGRVAAFEVMLMNAAIGNLIRKGETHKIQSTIQTSKRFGMVTLDDYLLDLVRSGVVTGEVALEAAQNRDDLASRL